MSNVLWICSEVGGVNWFRAKTPYDALMETKGKRDDYAIIHYDPGVIVRINWENDLYDPAKSYIVRSDMMQAVGWADVVIWMGLHTPESLNLFKLAKWRYPHIKMLMEIDDYLLSSARSNKRAGEVYCYGGDLAKIGLEQMRLSDALIVSTPSLGELYKPYAKKIYVVENTVDLRLWPKPKKRDRLTVGWIGAGSHDDDLALVKKPMDAILAKYPDVKFSIVHGAPEFFKHKDDCPFLLNPRDPAYNKLRRCPKCKGRERVNWTHDFKTIDKYPKWASSFGFDIGLAPLVDLNFTRGKSNLRWLEYSAMGIPTIASPLNHFVETIRDGETGIIVKDNSERGWIDAIETLIEEPDLRKSIGKAARMEVKKNWCPKVMAQKYKKILQEMTHVVDDSKRTRDADRDVNQRPVEHEVYSGAEAG